MNILIAGVVAALCGALASAAHTTEIAFTYLSLSEGKVITTSTSYPATLTPPPSPHGRPTSFQVNSSALAYPTFPSVPLAEAGTSPAPGLPNVTALLLEAAELIELQAVANASNCAVCKQVFTSVAARMKVQQETLAVISTPFCAELGAAGIIPTPICVGLLNVAST